MRTLYTAATFAAKGDGLDFDEARYEEIECISLKQAFDEYDINSL